MMYYSPAVKDFVQYISIEDSFKILKKHTWQYLCWKFPVYSGWERKNIVGWNVSATSELRKKITIERVKKVMEENNIDFEILDKESNGWFQILVKQ